MRKKKEEKEASGVRKLGQQLGSAITAVSPLILWGRGNGRPSPTYSYPNKQSEEKTIACGKSKRVNARWLPHGRTQHLTAYTRRGFIGTIIVLTLFLILLLWPIVTHAGSDNMLANPSFEEGTTQYRTYGNGRYGLTSVAHSGSKGFQIARDADDLTDKYGRLVTVIKHNPINNPEKLVFSTWLKSGSGSENVDIVLTFWASDGRSYLAARRNVVTVGSSWQQFNVTTSNIPNNAAYVRAEIRLRGAGTIYLDDLSLSTSGERSIDPPPPPPDEPISSGTIYVATNGSDSNPGTRERPLRHIQTAVDAARPGDTILVRGGTYVEEVKLTRSGKLDTPITLAGYGNERPVIDGRYELPTPPPSGWAECNTTVKPATCFHYKPLVEIAADHIVVEGFEVKNSLGRGIWVSNKERRISHIVIRNVHIHNHRNAGMKADRVDKLLFENNRVWHNSNYATHDRPAKVFNWSHAVNALRSTNVTYRNNIVFENYGEGIGTGRGSQNVSVINNEIYDNKIQIYVHRTVNATVEGNLTYCTQRKAYYRGGQPGAGIVLNNEYNFPELKMNTNIQIVNNLITGCVQGVGLWSGGGEIATGSYDVTIAHNTITQLFSEGDERKTVGIHIISGPHKQIRVYNNIVQGADLMATTGAPATFSHNLWSQQPSREAARGQGDIIGNARLVDAGRTLVAGQVNPAWYKLTSSSPAIDEGKVSEVATDFWSTKRDSQPDMGFHER
jgi:hypothetical protein